MVFRGTSDTLARVSYKHRSGNFERPEDKSEGVKEKQMKHRFCGILYATEFSFGTRPFPIRWGLCSRLCKHNNP